MDFKRSGLKTGVKNNILWSEIGSGEPGDTPPPRIPFVFVITRILLNRGSLYRGSVPQILEGRNGVLAFTVIG